MRRIMIFLLTLTMVFACFDASAQTPAFLTEPMSSYTADYKVSMTLESSDDIIALLDELDMPEEADNFIDIKSLIESMFTCDSQMHLEASMSNDFRKLDAALTASMPQSVVYNRNLTMSMDMKCGIWINMDLDNAIFKAVYSMPIAEKYVTIDLMELASEDEKQEMMGFFNSIYNKDRMESMSKRFTDIMMKHADVDLKPLSCVVKYDNDSFVAAIEELIPAVIEEIKPVIDPVASSGDIDLTEQILSLDGLQLLGDDGLTCTYTLRGGKISRCVTNMDISLSAANIYTMITGEPWKYSSEGIIRFRLTEDMSVSKIGITKPSFPVLTEENSVSITELFGYNQYSMTPENYDNEWENEDYCYISDWPGGWMEELISENGRYYVPLRYCLEDAYGECAHIDYADGLVTITCEHFDSLEAIILTVGDSVAYAGGASYDIGAVKLVNGSVYVTTDFFTECLGWYIEYFDHSLIGDGVYYGFGINSEWSDWE